MREKEEIDIRRIVLLVILFIAFVIMAIVSISYERKEQKVVSQVVFEGDTIKYNQYGEVITE